MSGFWVGPDAVWGQLLSFGQFPASAYQQLILGTLLSPPLRVGWGWVGLWVFSLEVVGLVISVSGFGQTGVDVFNS